MAGIDLQDLPVEQLGLVEIACLVILKARSNICDTNACDSVDVDAVPMEVLSVPAGFHESGQMGLHKNSRTENQ